MPDLRRNSVNEVLNETHPIRGATIQLKAVLNFWMPKEGVIRASVLGSESQSPSIRIDGVRINAPWVNAAIARALTPDPSRDLPTMALLSRLSTAIPPGIPVVEKQKMLTDAFEALTEGFSKLDPISQAWLLTTFPKVEALQPIISMAQKSTNKHVQISYLLYHVISIDDPMIEAAMRNDDKDVRFIAELLDKVLKKSINNKQ